MTYKAIIFDFFDVINSDTWHAWLRAHNLQDDGAQGEANRQFDLDQISVEEYYRKIGEVSDQTASEVKAEMAAASKINWEAVALIKRLKSRGFKLGLISNSHSQYIREILDQHQLEPLFDVLIISGEIGYSKPSPEIFHYALDKLQTLASEVVFIDDNPKNVAAAEQLDLTAIRFSDVASLQTALAALGIEIS